MILLLVTYSPIPHSHPPRLEIAPLGRLGRARRVTKPPLSPLPPLRVGAALARPPLDSGERKSLSQLARSELQHALSQRQGAESPGSRQIAGDAEGKARRGGEGGRESASARGAGASTGRRVGAPAQPPPTPDRASWAPEATLATVRPQQASNTMTIVSFELGVGNASRQRGRPGSHRRPRLGLACGRPRGTGTFAWACWSAALGPAPVQPRRLPGGEDPAGPATPQIQNRFLPTPPPCAVPQLPLHRGGQRPRVGPAAWASPGGPRRRRGLAALCARVSPAAPRTWRARLSRPPAGAVCNAIP
ncbi:PREDICTED: translation initiation factor IF-2-like [Chinchilla lanigera]|uniref:translation initiation factor IF-2-like n=1 Tax=Chinchilla lanigera TaxID=34839 RepID=UPI0006980D62|nr:PREDICTED: translation initiation factor IF-2-like [Chinchilla lanigera]